MSVAVPCVFHSTVNQLKNSVVKTSPAGPTGDSEAVKISDPIRFQQLQLAELNSFLVVLVLKYNMYASF